MRRTNGENIGVRRDVLTRISKENLEVDFTSTGEIHSIRSGDILLNQLFRQEIDGALGNIYLRFLEADKIKFYHLIGSRSDSRFFVAESQAMWQVKIEGISYHVRLKLAENAWFWQVSLSGHKEKVDLVYVNDISLADRAALLSNEAYNAQYINHQIFDTYNFKIISRQNQAQFTGFPVLETGALGDKVVTGYATDVLNFLENPLSAHVCQSY